MSDVSSTWAPFDHALFEDSAHPFLKKVGVIDVGSNSVRMVVFDGAARSPAYYYNEKIMCALGAGVSKTGILNPTGRKRALAAIERFVHLARGMGVPKLTAVATAAVRDASDGEDFCREVLQKTGQKIWIIDGREEARLSAQGVLLGWPGSYGLVCDIGGSSMELAEIGDGQVRRRVSSDLGPLKLLEIKGGKKGRAAHIKQVVEQLADELGPQHNRLFLVGGSWRALARIDMERRKYPLHVMHEYRMSIQSVRDTIEFLDQTDHAALRIACGVSSARMDLVPYAAEVLKRLIHVFRPKDIAISSYGIREGMLYEEMPQDLRERDPLIEACQYAEMKDARFPGYGDRLYQFLQNVFPKTTPELDRLARSACYLHDVSWRAHPDYRAEVCFDNATRANLGGLKHSERVFLGLALLHRYKNNREGSPFANLFTLVKPDQIRNAEILGKAMRLGAMLWIVDPDQNAELFYDKKKKTIVLKMSDGLKPLFGEVAEARFQSLATTLSAKPVVQFFGA